jgi:hypothetical protein
MRSRGFSFMLILDRFGFPGMVLVVIRMFRVLFPATRSKRKGQKQDAAKNIFFPHVLPPI